MNNETQTHTSKNGETYYKGDRIMNNETQTHTSKNGETYYSRVEDGEIIYSFTTDFADIWTQDEEELYGQNKSFLPDNSPVSRPCGMSRGPKRSR